AAAPHAADELVQLVVAGAGAQRRAQVGALGREQAGIERAVGRDPRPRAIAAERLRHRGDEAELATAVLEGVTLGHFTAVITLARRDRPARVNQFAQLARRHDQLLIPVVA